MNPEIWNQIQTICQRLSTVTYENLTKIIRLESTGSSTAAQHLDDSWQNDVDSWMGGGTCFSMTWHLYQVFMDMGLKPRLVMGHKRKEKNIHCALILPDSEGLFSGPQEYLFDPGYLIFDPLQMPSPPPFGTGDAFFPLVPNCVKLVRKSMEQMELWTGGAGSPMKLRFEYPVAGVSPQEFKEHWNESFYREMMTYPVLNRLDRERGIQYYYQKGNLVTRDKNGSKMVKIEKEKQVSTLSEVFGIHPEIIEKALKVLEKP
ncbi:MAG: hypothetical protein HUK21_10220 [Fibrobacteraceae bacterium]|nr:hypothetical protein [Fibrobacteraceae bacterium]